MKKFFFFIVILCGIGTLKAQNGINPKDSSWKKLYRGSYTKINDLVHTKLEVKFDYPKSWMYGKAWITLKPNFYSTSSVNIYAHRMNFI